MGTFGVGAASRDITPSPQLLAGGRVWLWGYGEDYVPARMNPCTTVRDPLQARAVVIRDADGSEAVVVTADLGSLEYGLTESVRSRVTAAHGLPPEALCVNVSHTHSAPAISTIPTWWHGPAGGFDRPDPEYRAFVEDQLVAVVDDAYGAVVPADLWFGRGQCGIGFNRHAQLGGPDEYDQTLDVVKATADDGSTVAVLFCYACHATGSVDDTVISANFPGVARQGVEAATGGTALYLQGFAGTVGCRSDAANGVDIVYDGKVLAGDVLTVLNGPLTQVAGDIATRASLISLPFEPLPAGAIAQAATGDALRRRWAAHLTAQGAAVPGALPTQLQYLRIGNWHLLACAHEVTNDLAPAVRAAAGSPLVTLAGYANIQLSYLPSRQVLQKPKCTNYPFCDANYEGGSAFAVYGHRAPLTEDVDERLIRGYRNLIEDWQARHGLTGDDYQVTFEELTGSGYRPLDVCGWPVGASSRHAGIWSREAGPAWVARHRISPAEFQEVFDELDGYRPVVVSGYSHGGVPLYAGIWVQDDSVAWVARHGLSSAQYQDQVNLLTGQGYQPVVVSGYADGGQPAYAAIWHRSDTGWAARHGLTSAQYQQEFDALLAQGYRPVWVSAYTVAGTDLFAAIWTAEPGPAWEARHDLSPEQYQSTFDELLAQGYLLRHGCGYHDGQRYAGIWQRAD